MKRINLMVAGVLASALVAPAVMADASFTDAQKKEIQTVIHNYLISNPEVLIEASQEIQKKQQDIQKRQVQTTIEESAPQLLNDTLTIAGNPKGNVTLIEFFDYQCIHCKKMAPVIDELVKQNPNLRVMYKEFPIFGKSSEVASRAALAAGMQGKYAEMHNALLNENKHLTEALVMDIAKAQGLNMDKLQKDMASTEVTDQLDLIREMAEKMHLMGTPAFVIVATPDGKFKAGSKPTFVPGAASSEALQEMIKEAATAATAH